MASPAEIGVAAWHEYVRNVSAEKLDEILSDEVVFMSPVVHTPQVGKAAAKMYLMAAFNVFPGDDPSGASKEDKPKGKFKYVREVIGERDAVLEFETEMDGIHVNGVDMIAFDDAGKIVDFKVMIRPLKAIQKVHAQMGAMLEKLKG